MDSDAIVEAEHESDFLDDGDEGDIKQPNQSRMHETSKLSEYYDEEDDK